MSSTLGAPRVSTSPRAPAPRDIVSPKAARLDTETTACNLCGSGAARPLFTENYRLGQRTAELSVVRCLGCSLVYVSPRLTLEETARVYSDDAAETISEHYSWHDDAAGSQFQRLLNNLAGVAPRGRLLDVGCGTGVLLAEAQRQGHWEIAGLDPSPRAIDAARTRLNCPLWSTTLENAPVEEGSFDVVTLFGVLEHLHDPRGTLERVHRLLRPGGAVGIYVPNFHYLRWKDAGPAAWLRSGRWSLLHPQEHVHQFTPQTLEAMLQRTGFAQRSLDLGHPYYHGGLLSRVAKRVGLSGVKLLKRCTGVHLAALEAVATKV